MTTHVAIDYPVKVVEFNNAEEFAIAEGVRKLGTVDVTLVLEKHGFAPGYRRGTVVWDDLCGAILRRCGMEANPADRQKTRRSIAFCECGGIVFAKGECRRCYQRRMKR